MSSVVNKSNKKFAPRAPTARGTARKPRQLSTTEPPKIPLLPSQPLLPTPPPSQSSLQTNRVPSRRESAIGTRPVVRRESIVDHSKSILSPAPSQATLQRPRAPSFKQATQTSSQDPNPSLSPRAVRRTPAPLERPTSLLTPRPKPYAGAPAGRLASLKRPTSIAPIARPQVVEQIRSLATPEPRNRAPSVVSVLPADVRPSTLLKSLVPENAIEDDDEEEDEVQGSVAAEVQSTAEVSKKQLEKASNRIQEQSPHLTNGRDKSRSSDKGDVIEKSGDVTPVDEHPKDKSPSPQAGEPKGPDVDVETVKPSVSQTAPKLRSRRSVFSKPSLEEEEEREQEGPESQTEGESSQSESDVESFALKLRDRPIRMTRAKVAAASASARTAAQAKRKAKRQARGADIVYTNDGLGLLARAATEAELEPREPEMFVPYKENARDEKGRIVLDPDDLPAYGRGYKAVPVHDAENKVVNVKTFKMADLCRELPIGQKNEDYERYEEARTKKRYDRELFLQKRRDARERGEFIPVDEMMADMDAKFKEKREQFQADYRSASNYTAPAAPRLVYDIETGQIGIDLESTVVDRQQHATAQIPDRETVDMKDDSYSRWTNSASFAKRERPERWDDVETLSFYKALSQWGTDFNLIASLFPGRSRRQIKSKFKLEERRNPTKIHLAILRKLPIDLEEFSAQSRQELKTVQSIEEELEEIRRKHEEEMKVHDESIAKLRKEDAELARKREFEQFGPVGEPDRKRMKNGIKVDGEEEEEEEVVGELPPPS